MANNTFQWLRQMFSKPGQFLELRHYALLGELTPYELRLVNGYLHKREFKAGETIFEQGFPLEVIYLIASGEVQVTGVSIGNCEMLLGKYKFLGVIDIFGKNKRFGSAKASKDTILLALSQTDFWELVNKNHTLGVKLLTACCRFLSKYILDSAQAHK